MKNPKKAAKCLAGSCFTLALFSFAACGAPPADEFGAEEDPGAYTEASTASVVMEYEGSCSWLKACANPSGATACGNICDDATPFVATPFDPRTVPSRTNSSCKKTARICLKSDPRKCVDAHMWDKSCCGRWEANVAVLKALGVSFGDGARCSGRGSFGNVSVTITY